MTQEENSLENVNARKKRERFELHPAWLKDVFIRPKWTLEKVAEQDKPVWLMPLLVITVMVLLVAIIGGPVRKANIEASMQQPPDGFQYWSDADQQAYFQRQQNALSPIFVYVFPFIKEAAGYWLLWALFSSVLHLTLTLRGSRAPRARYSNLVAWGMAPFILRLIMQLLNLLINKNADPVIPPQAAWIPADARGFMAFLKGVLGAIDAYWVFFAVLVVMGTIALSGLKKGKAVGSALAALAILLLFNGIPGLISSFLGGLSGSGGMYWF